MHMPIQRCCSDDSLRLLLERLSHGVRKRNVAAAFDHIPRAISGDHRQPGRKFRWIADSPPRLPSFDERVLNGIFGLLAILQNAVSDGEKSSTVCANYHFKGIPVAVNGRSILLALIGFHHVDLKT